MTEGETVAAQIRQARSKHSFTRAGLAERVGVSAGDITAFEHGTRLPDSATLSKIAAVLALDAGPLLSVLRRNAPQTAQQEAQEPVQSPPASIETPPVRASDTTPTNAMVPAPARGGEAMAAQEEQGDRPSEDTTQPAARSAPARRTAAQPEHADGSDELTEQIVALLERVSGKRFVYQNGEAWLVAPDDGVRVPSRLLAAYALLTNVLLAGTPELGEQERAELRRAHQHLLGGPSAMAAAPKRGRQRSAS